MPIQLSHASLRHYTVGPIVEVCRRLKADIESTASRLRIAFASFCFHYECHLLRLLKQRLAARNDRPIRDAPPLAGDKDERPVAESSRTATLRSIQFASHLQAEPDNASLASDNSRDIDGMMTMFKDDDTESVYHYTAQDPDGIDQVALDTHKPSDTTSSDNLFAGRRRGLLITCSYFGCAVKDFRPLLYSYRDAYHMKGLLLRELHSGLNLLEGYGWQESEITVLSDAQGVDSDSHSNLDNIIKHLELLVKDARAGDLLFVHFSGHGYQRPAVVDEFEADGMDEFIFPCDFEERMSVGADWFILDDDLRRILVGSLPKGVKLIALFDSCSSGTLLDLPIAYRKEKEEIVPVFKSTDGDRHTLQIRAPVRKDTLSLQPDASGTQSNVCYLEDGIISPANVIRLPIGSAPTFLPASSPRGVRKTEHHTRGQDGAIASQQCRRVEARDDRTIEAEVISISSCADSSQTFETAEGGILATHFCRIMRESVDSGRAITVAELRERLIAGFENTHKEKEKETKAVGQEWRDDWVAPVPQLWFSQATNAETAEFTLSL